MGKISSKQIGGVNQPRNVKRTQLFCQSELYVHTHAALALYMESCKTDKTRSTCLFSKAAYIQQVGMA